MSYASDRSEPYAEVYGIEKPVQDGSFDACANRNWKALNKARQDSIQRCRFFDEDFSFGVKCLFSVEKYVTKDRWIKIVHIAEASVEQMPIE